MLKIGLTVAATAACCFAIAAATGLGAAAPKVITMKVNEIISLESDNFHCEALKTTEVACGGDSLPNSTQVYYAPGALEVVKLNSTGKEVAKLLYSAKR